MEEVLTRNRMTGNDNRAMRKAFVSIIVLLAAAILPARSQGYVSERVYVSTDRDVYVAGDELFFSAFCLNTTNGGLSDGSRTAYLELVSSDGPVQTAKVALEEGRGGGMMSLLNTIPTGNYRLVAYTAQCFNENGYDFLEGARTLSIINPFTTARASSGVEILPEEDYIQLRDGNPHLSAGGIALNTSGPVTITNNTDRPVSLSLSVYHDDGIPSPETVNPVSFASKATSGRNFTDRRTADFEGEIVRARLVGTAEDITAAEGSQAFLCIPGRIDDLYSSVIQKDGTVTFYTRNIYGDTDMVLDPGASAGNTHLEIIPPFSGVSDPDIPSLPLSTSLQERILQRSMSMQVLRATGADSLYSVLPVPSFKPFNVEPAVYHLDDYTRFPLMEELFIEYISEVSIRRTRSGRELIVSLHDDFRSVPYALQPCLALLDGVPVTDHNQLLEYDPLLVEKIVIYQNTFFLGGRTYPGVINFVTYKQNLPSYTFGDNVRVVEFQGVSYPVVSWLPDTSGQAPDLRQTILWHPQIELAPGESRTFEYCLPSYQGRFDVVVEGFDSAGNPVCAGGVIAN